VGGTGPWKAIRGVGTTLPGTAGPREDRNFVLNWQFDWKIE